MLWVASFMLGSSIHVVAEGNSKTPDEGTHVDVIECSLYSLLSSPGAKHSLCIRCEGVLGLYRDGTIRIFANRDDYIARRLYNCVDIKPDQKLATDRKWKWADLDGKNVLVEGIFQATEKALHELTKDGDNVVLVNVSPSGMIIVSRVVLN
jgi:hypothetical protein